MKNFLLFAVTAATFLLAVINVIPFGVFFIVLMLTIGIAATTSRSEVAVEPHRYDY